MCNYEYHDKTRQALMRSLRSQTCKDAILTSGVDFNGRILRRASHVKLYTPGIYKHDKLNKLNHLRTLCEKGLIMPYFN